MKAFLFFLSLFSFSYSALALEEARHHLNVIIDPGHGGNDQGATILQNQKSIFIKESELTLDLSRKILDLIHEKYSHELNAQLTREGNQYISLPKRIQFANKENADVYVSLHYNSAFSHAISGAEIYFPQENKIPDDKSLSVLESIKQDIIETGRIKKSLSLTELLAPEWKLNKVKIRRAPFYILEKSNSPAILIEVGYLTNNREQKTLLNIQSQQSVAESIVKALLSFKEIRDKQLN